MRRVALLLLLLLMLLLLLLLGEHGGHEFALVGTRVSAEVKRRRGHRSRTRRSMRLLRLYVGEKGRDARLVMLHGRVVRMQGGGEVWRERLTRCRHAAVLLLL